MMYYLACLAYSIAKTLFTQAKHTSRISIARALPRFGFIECFCKLFHFLQPTRRARYAGTKKAPRFPAAPFSSFHMYTIAQDYSGFLWSIQKALVREVAIPSDNPTA